ncbi:MAG TPA: Gfo/Idh/MocA family oxidoreductase [Planctomycetaceae bacterium]|nr:Gfo/Idh/MocA family oxidoreductase [Planctomycetaceae bacterium]
MTGHRLPRRAFLQTAAATLAASTGWRHATAQPRPAPSERITVAAIGLGERGFAVLNEFLAEPDVQVVFVCDVHDLHYREREWGKGKALGRKPAAELVQGHYAAQTKSGLYRGCQAEADFQELLTRNDRVDAVLVATPDHWHALITLALLRSGHDVYCEKPVTHLFAEGQQVYREVAERKAILQVGSQQRSDPLFRQAVELVRNGHIGKVQKVEVGLPPGYSKPMGDPAVLAVPDGLDYHQWCGPSPVLPYTKARHHRWWRGNTAYGGGVLMDFIGHHNDIAHWGLDQEAGGPTRVEAVGWTFPDTPVYDTPAVYNIRCEYPNGVTSTISSELPTGVKFLGETGWVYVTRGKISCSDKRWEDPKFVRGDWHAYLSPGHVRNFVDGVKTRKACVAPAENAHRAITPGHLAYVSQTLGKPLKWDAKTETIVGDADAQRRLMAVTYRSPWTLT